MKILIALSVLVLVFTASCDKVEFPVQPQVSNDFDTTLYPGNFNTYYNTEWPNFAENTNTNRNVLIEDFTGHRCPNCPPAADEAVNIANNNPGRVVIASIHAGNDQNDGIVQFQETNADFPEQFYNDIVVEYGKFFANGYQFVGNPRGTVNRTPFDANDDKSLFGTAAIWGQQTSAIISANDLKVNLQSKVNYFSQSHAIYYHLEVDLLDPSIKDEIKVVNYYVEKKFVAPQKYFANTITDYEHHNIVRDELSKAAFGLDLSSAEIDAAKPDRYLMNYSYELPADKTADNSMVISYVYNTNTLEVYQVIETEIQP
ncbi:Omp28-related outer membrane protein [Lishizhenia sp.]|uniref:Omp28-related outer membrane protein n=1 Tax=Lishizhenia sp. TaxID=2497594 RepID=UPI00299F19D0|nr:Omp28-related outer membrane protein [Lishizhenia sp.]MDX1446219.1 Omp28-related outer membrane protein [Lishizhenia sp.]